MEQFGAKPILDLDMRLGEGTGAALAMTVIEAAVKIYNEMATFSGAGVSQKE
jgi:nicotinate-nucleotide--dimethylbenzimidazole phosphoribosyltransferase